MKRKLGRIWHFVETTDIDMADASDRIKEHLERQERLEDAAADARAILSQRRAVLDDVNTIAAYAQDMSEFLKESELTERRAFIETFVKEIVVMPGDALLRYTIPMPDDSPIPGRNAEEMALNGSVLSTVKNGGACTYRIANFSLGGPAVGNRSPSSVALREPSSCHGWRLVHDLRLRYIIPDPNPHYHLRAPASTRPVTAFAIVLGYVDSPDGLRLVRSALQLVDEHRHLALVVRLERNPRLAVHAVGLAARSRQYPFSRYVHPVVPAQ